MKDAHEVRMDLMQRVAAERRKMIEKTIERHNLDVSSSTVDAMVGVTSASVPPADAIHEGALKGEGDGENASGGVRPESSDAKPKTLTLKARGRAGKASQAAD